MKVVKLAWGTVKFLWYANPMGNFSGIVRKLSAELDSGDGWSNNSLVRRLRSERFDYRELFILIVFGVIANIYFLSTFSPSIDDELAAVRSDSSVWIAQGRFSVYLVESLLFPQSATPFSPYLLLILCIGVAYMLLVRAHGYEVSWKTYASFFIFVTFPTWWLISEFTANVPSIGLGFLFVSLATYLSDDGRDPALFKMISVKRGFSVVVLLAFATGAYQSLLIVFVSMSSGVALIKCLRSKENNKALAIELLKRIIQIGILLTFAGFLYMALTKAAQTLLGVQPVYIDSFVQPELVAMAPLWLFWSITKEAWAVYSGSSTIYGASMPIAGPVLIFASTCVLLSSARKMVLLAVLLLVLLGSPFILHILTGPGNLPMRSMLALPYVTWLITMLLLGASTAWVAVAGSVLLGLYQLQIVNLTSQYVAAATVTQQYDRMIAVDIGRRLLELKDANQSGIPILLDVYGYRDREHTSVYAAARTSVTKGSFFGWDKGDIDRITAYMAILGFDQIKPLPETERRALTPQFDLMPVWPLTGSIKRVGPLYLVKLGRHPDKAHVAFDK